MGVASRIGKGIDSGSKALYSAGKVQAKAHPRVASAIGGFGGGALYMNHRKSNSQFYTGSSNNGRAINKHPYGGYYG